MVKGGDSSNDIERVKAQMTVLDQNHRASQATRATTNVKCAVCCTNVKADNSKGIPVTATMAVVVVESEGRETGWDI